MNLRFLICFLFVFFITFHNAFSQYPFEKFPAPKIERAGPWEGYNRVETEGKFQWAIPIKSFYEDSSSVTVQITSFVNSDSSVIRIYKGKKQIQKMIEPFPIERHFGMLRDSLTYADFNNDSLKDIKIKAYGGGNGLAAYYHRIIYLFQREDGTFEKVSFTNMELVEHPERDLDGDGNFEIIGTYHEYYRDHSYWVFNIYRFEEGRWQCVNSEFDYPILVQMLYRQNYEITNKVSRSEMKAFELKYPKDFSGKKK